MQNDIRRYKRQIEGYSSLFLKAVIIIDMCSGGRVVKTMKNVLLGFMHYIP